MNSDLDILPDQTGLPVFIQDDESPTKLSIIIGGGITCPEISASVRFVLRDFELFAYVLDDGRIFSNEYNEDGETVKTLLFQIPFDFVDIVARRYNDVHFLVLDTDMNVWLLKKNQNESYDVTWITKNVKRIIKIETLTGTSERDYDFILLREDNILNFVYSRAPPGQILKSVQQVIPELIDIKKVIRSSSFEIVLTTMGYVYILQSSWIMEEVLTPQHEPPVCYIDRKHFANFWLSWGQIQNAPLVGFYPTDRNGDITVRRLDALFDLKDLIHCFDRVNDHKMFYYLFHDGRVYYTSKSQMEPILVTGDHELSFREIAMYRADDETTFVYGITEVGELLALYLDGLRITKFNSEYYNNSKITFRSPGECRQRSSQPTKSSRF